MKLLTMPEVAEMVRVSVKTLRNWRTIGHGPKSARLGRKVVYREDDVRRWIDEHFETDAAS